MSADNVIEFSRATPADVYRSYAYLRCTEPTDLASVLTGQLLHGETSYACNIHRELLRAIGVLRMLSDSPELLPLMYIDHMNICDALNRLI
jgi:hypothetical protein